VCHISRDVSPLFVVLHSLSFDGTSRFIKGRWRVSILGFLILWARSQVGIHHLAHLMDLSGARCNSL